MATKKVRPHGPEFVVLVGHHPYGADPSHNNPVFQAPPPTRQAIGYQAVNTHYDGGVHATHVNARMGGAPPHTVQTASLTVADNDFTTGIARLVLGDYVLLSNIDYVVGGTVNATATNLAAAINNLPEFEATANLADVDIEYHVGAANEVEFKVFHEGTKTNFTPLTPADGFMAKGEPSVSAPRLI